VKLLRGHGEFSGKTAWPHAQSNGNVAQNVLQTFELYHLTFSQVLEGKEWINMRDPSTKDGDVYSGGSRGGARGPAPLIF